ncbi:MAG: RNA pyrophosphohydrolase [Rhizobiaceae bacterium]
MSNLPYRPNVGIMVLNTEGKVWTGNRANTIGTEYENANNLWQMPQGGIDEGEDAHIASLRELYEETGMKSVTLLDSTDDWIYYDFPAELTKKISEKHRGQKQKWFAYRFEGDESEIQINPPPDGHKAEFDNWRWEDMHRLPELIVEFKRGVYEQVVKRFAHLAG